MTLKSQILRILPLILKTSTGDELTRGHSTWLLPVTGGGSLPSGIICMWHGLLANVPAGWAICDGNNGTPDLVAKFVKGATGEAGTTGGAATHTHTGHAAHQVTQPADHAAVSHSAHGGTAVGTSGAGSSHGHGGSATHSNIAPVISWPAGPPTNAAHAHDNHTITTKFTTSGSGTAANTLPVTHSSVAPVISWPAGAPTNAGHTHDAHGNVGAESAHTHVAGSVTQPGAHTDHAAQAHIAAAVDAHSAHDSVNHEPAYYEAIYIMKV